MSLYRYVKTVSRVQRKKTNLLPVLFLVVGFFLIANVVWPILFYQVKIKAKIQKPESEVILEYNQPSTWFPSAPRLPPRPSKITHYTLSIPKLNIEEAIIEIGGTDIMKSLVQYSGTAMPGQYGNAVIFGHSVLPQFFNPKNYKTIFATLPTLEKGDEILVSFDGILYRYQVIDMVEVDPADVSVLAQHYDSQYLTLVTCVPPGTYLRRLIVRAKLT